MNRVHPAAVVSRHNQLWNSLVGQARDRFHEELAAKLMEMHGPKAQPGAFGSPGKKKRAKFRLKTKPAHPHAGDGFIDGRGVEYLGTDRGELRKIFRHDGRMIAVNKWKVRSKAERRRLRSAGAAEILPGCFLLAVS